MEVERKLAAMGLTLPPPLVPVANYVPVVRSGNLLFLCGHAPAFERGGAIGKVRGKVGSELTTEDGYAAARQVALNMLRTIKEAIGNLDNVVRVVKLLGFVNCTDDFQETPNVINGASDLFVALYGERGRHARSAVGSNQLPVLRVGGNRGRDRGARLTTPAG